MKKILIAAMLASTALLGACSTMGPSHESTAQAEPPAYTKDYVVDIYTGYDDDGNINQTRLDANGNVIPQGQLTYMESKMLDSTDRYCTTELNQVVGRFGYDLKGVVRFGVLQGLGTALGAVEGFAGSSFTSYLKYAGIAGAGGGLAAGEMTWEESIRVVHSYCVMMWVQKNSTENGDQRLKHIMIYPLIAGKAHRPGHTANDGVKFERTNRSNGEERETSETTTPPPLPPPH
jgi:hypothetical protein